MDDLHTLRPTDETTHHEPSRFDEQKGATR